MTRINAARSWLFPTRACTCAIVAALSLFSCSPGNGDGTPAIDTDPSAVTGELVTYVADFGDGHSERWQALRTADGHEVRLEFDTPPLAHTGNQVRVHGQTFGENLHVSRLEVLPSTAIAAEGADPNSPELIAAPAQDTYALVLVDLGSGVDLTAAQGLKDLFSTAAADKSFASYYSESSYGKYTVSGDVIGPFQFSMTTCDTTGMYKAIEPMITGTYNHLIYYFNSSKLCTFGGLGEEGSSSKPAKRTWMNGSLSCVVLMQEPGHNLGLMHANTMKCGTSSFSTTPATSCTITEYGSGLTTMGGGCKQLNAYERWYMQWLTGCNGVRVPASGTFNLLPLESNCSSGTGVQVLQVPFPATLTVNDPQATTTNVNLNNYYVELRAAGGIFDAYSTRTTGSLTFTGPTVFIYTSDNVRVPATPTGGRGGGGSQNSVWTELLNMTPSGTSFTGLTTAGQSFTDPAGGATITLTSISATGATITVTNPNGTGSPTCINGTTLAAPGPTSCAAAGVDGGAPSTGAGGTTGAAGTNGAAGTKGTGGTTGAAGTKGAAGTTGAGGTTTTPTGGTNGTGGTSGTAPGTGGTSVGAGGTATGGIGVPNETGGLKGGCACDLQPGPLGRSGFASLWMSGLACAIGLLRRRRRPTI